MLKEDLKEQRNVTNPGHGAKNILLVDALYGYGDALYVNGLACMLAKHNCNVTVATLARTHCIYEGNKTLTALYNLENENDILNIKNKIFDIVVDLSYVDLDRWSLRFNLIKDIEAWVLSCSNFTKKQK